jgi:hypothetical protein
MAEPTTATNPSWIQKFLLLAGRRASSEHRDWIEGILSLDSRPRGFLLALPNAVIVLVLAVFSAVSADDMTFAILWAFAAIIILAAGAMVPRLSASRARHVAKKNGLSAP